MAFLKAVLYSILFCLALLLSSILINEVLGDTRIKIAVMDTGLNFKDKYFKPYLCSSGHRDFTNSSLIDNMNHGTPVAYLITKKMNKDKYCLVIIKAYNTDFHGIKPFVDSLKYINDNNFKYVNISLTGPQKDINEKTLIEISKSKFFVAAGNDSKSYLESFPGGYNLDNVTVVGNWDCHSDKANKSSNFGDKVKFECGTDVLARTNKKTFKYMTGSSFSSPTLLAKELK